MDGNKSFKGMEEWKRENEKGQGGGRLISVKGARFEDHRDALQDVREKKQRQSEQGSNPGSSWSR